MLSGSGNNNQINDNKYCVQNLRQHCMGFAKMSVQIIEPRKRGYSF